MRNALITRLVFPLGAVAAIGVWAACGGSDGQDVVTNEDAGSDSGGNSDSGNNNMDDDSGMWDAGNCNVTDSGKVYDAGEPNVLDAGDEFEGGIPCVVGGELEEEPNDTELTANELRPTRCGVVRADGGADGGESDFVTFQIADASTNFYVQYAGNVKVRVETDGQAPVDITTNPPPTLKFVRGQPYYAEVRSADGKTHTWRVTLFQE